MISSHICWPYDAIKMADEISRHLECQQPICGCLRLLHIPSLVANGLSMRCETLQSNRLESPFVIDWCKYRPGLPQSQCIELTWMVGISSVLHRLLTVPLHSLKGCARRLSKSLWMCVSWEHVASVNPHSTGLGMCFSSSGEHVLSDLLVLIRKVPRKSYFAHQTTAVRCFCARLGYL